MRLVLEAEKCGVIIFRNASSPNLGGMLGYRDSTWKVKIKLLGVGGDVLKFEQGSVNLLNIASEGEG